MKKVILVKYGEIALRGKNRYLYENSLIKAIYKNIGYNNGFSIRKEQGRLLVERMDGSDIDFASVTPKIKIVLGVVAVCPCFKTEDMSIGSLREIALNYISGIMGENHFTFKVESKRANKKYPLTSQDISREIGGYIYNSMDNADVNVKNPELVLFVELRNFAYVYANAEPGFGGLPVGSSGRGMVLLSGGIDSPAAAFLMAKRGVYIEAVYFHSPPFTQEQALIKVMDLAKQLARFTGGLKLYVVNFTEVQTFLYENVPHDKLTIFLKRAMLRIAQMAAEKNKCQCLITGDSVGQVASQTLQAIEAVESATVLPIIRPLAGMDKTEITKLASKIGTFDISIRPYNDCCTLFVAKHPETRPKTSVIEKIEAHLAELEDLLRNAFENINLYEL